jgi:hypothetical protein
MEELKGKGIDAIKKGNFEAAASFYAEALALAKREDTEAIAALHSNRSYALLRLGQASQVSCVSTFEHVA